MIQTESNLGKLIKQKRVSVPLTLCELGSSSGVSPSHLGRIERNERLPSARVLRKIAKPLGFKEEELFMIAGFLSGPSSENENPAISYNRSLKLDPLAANILSQEPAEVQRAIIGILSLLKIMARVKGDEDIPND